MPTPRTAPRVAMINASDGRVSFLPMKTPSASASCSDIHRTSAAEMDDHRWSGRRYQTLRPREPLAPGSIYSLPASRFRRHELDGEIGDRPAALTSAIRSAIASIDKDQPIFAIATMQQLVNDSVSTRRITLILLGVFSALALVLASDRNLRRAWLTPSRSAPMKSGFAWRWARGAATYCA